MNVNRRIILSLIFVSALFLMLVTYLVYFNHFRASGVTERLAGWNIQDDEARILRGRIYSADGVVLAYTEPIDGGTNVRRYPHRELYSGVIGYSSAQYGRTQLELSFNRQLMGRGGLNLTFDDVRRGFDLHLTLDHELQQLANELLRGRNGAVVAIEPSSGRILAMASNPNFDPHNDALLRNWDSLIDDPNSPLLPRATQGLYAPGSAFKIITAAAAFEAGMHDRTFNDTGAFNRGGINVRNHNNVAFGEIDLPRAFAVSSNYVFCYIGYSLGAAAISDVAGRFGVGTPLDFDIPTEQSRLGYDVAVMTAADSALVSIGQGRLLVTPLHMAMITATVANNGRMMRPFLVERATNDVGLPMFTSRQRAHSRPINVATAAYLTELMELAVTDGTGSAARIDGVRVAGKTGTAENDGALAAHAWFVGFAPVENPQIAVAVVLEHSGGTGGALAAPIARDVMRQYLAR